MGGGTEGKEELDASGETIADDTGEGAAVDGAGDDLGRVQVATEGGTGGAQTVVGPISGIVGVQGTARSHHRPPDVPCSGTLGAYTTGEL